KAAKELGYDFSGVDAPKNEKDFYGLRYAEFVVPLVKAVQELVSQNKELRTKNEELSVRNEDVAGRLTKLEALVKVLASEKKSAVSNLMGELK
ncbi:MAG TPA: hypothetical protein VGR15_07395, partial [Bacteroidota bacterium]|nr:hypothetical protein [Bacteroidota bacterium]